MQKKQDFIEKLSTKSGEVLIYSLKQADKILNTNTEILPFTIKIILENLLRYEDGINVTIDDIKSIASWNGSNTLKEISFMPARVLMQDYTGVPAIVDLASMRDAMETLGGDPNKINPKLNIDLVIDHSIQVDEYGKEDSLKKNVELEFYRNKERYEFLKWGQKAFSNFNVVPPGTGICHQVNLEHLGKVVWTEIVDNKKFVFPDTVVGTDSHTTMINGLGILGWGVGGIEAEAAMLGEPIYMLAPEVIGFKLTNSLKEGVTATDLVLTITSMLRAKGVTGKFVEFFGNGLDSLSLADRAIISNMAPEYGATCGFFPVDNETLNYLRITGRSEEQIELVELYTKKQGLWRNTSSKEPIFSDTLELNLQEVYSCIAGPKRPQDRVALPKAAQKCIDDMKTSFHIEKLEKNTVIGNGDVAIASITSCTNTSNPSVMIAAGLVAKKAVELGLQTKPWVKTSLAPGSKVVSAYLEDTGLQAYLDKLGFNIVGYGCTTCIGNSGPLNSEISDAIINNNLCTASILSGNRNFEGRINQYTKLSYLASPPLVVIYALTGSMVVDITKDPIGQNKTGENIFLKDLWPTNQEISTLVNSAISPKIFKEKYKDLFKGEKEWQEMNIPIGKTYKWDDESTYIKNPPYFTTSSNNKSIFRDINKATILAVLGDSITTDHISPAGIIGKNTPAALYLESKGIMHSEFNSYGARRGNHEVMIRGTFANIRIRNEITPGKEGGYTIYTPTNEVMPIYDASIKYIQENIPLVIIAGKEYGSGSSRDWAAKGTKLLGVSAIIAESFERIHRSNLIGMGVIPFSFNNGITRKDLHLTGREKIRLKGLESLNVNSVIECIIDYEGGEQKLIYLTAMIFTAKELEYLKCGGILNYVFKKLFAKLIANPSL